MLLCTAGILPNSKKVLSLRIILKMQDYNLMDKAG
jgi:hypothetical protein